MDGAILKEVAETVARLCELVAVGVVALGAAEALARLALGWNRWGDFAAKKAIFLRFASNIALALEFALAADVAETAISPSWQEIGQLAAIAAIRTALNYFLEKDIEKGRAVERRAE